MADSQKNGHIVIKIGGSLYDMPDLGSRLQTWLRRLDHPHVLLIPGGGRAADLVRDWDRRHRLGEEKAHWLALNALAFNARFLATVLRGSKVIEDLADRHGACASGDVPILNMWKWAQGDESQPDRLPHSWNVTSDSLAARVAVQIEASQLILLKSASAPEHGDWDRAAREGFVDTYFPTAIRKGHLQVCSVNFRGNW